MSEQQQRMDAAMQKVLKVTPEELKQRLAVSKTSKTTAAKNR